MLEKAGGSVTGASESEEAFLRFHKPVKLLPGTEYALRLCLQVWGAESFDVSCTFHLLIIVIEKSKSERYFICCKLILLMIFFMQNW